MQKVFARWHPHLRWTRVPVVFNDGIGTVGWDQLRSQDRRCKVPTQRMGPVSHWDWIFQVVKIQDKTWSERCQSKMTFGVFSFVCVHANVTSKALKNHQFWPRGWQCWQVWDLIAHHCQRLVLPCPGLGLCHSASGNISQVQAQRFQAGEMLLDKADPLACPLSGGSQPPFLMMLSLHIAFSIKLHYMIFKCFL